MTTDPGAAQAPYAEAVYPQAAEGLMAAHEHRKAIAHAWGQYVALDDIPLAGVNAFNRGSAVPVDHVERYGLEDDGLVARRGTPEARQAMGLPAEMERPAKSASKADWVEYAVANGVDAKAAQEFTRDELRAQFEEPSQSEQQSAQSEPQGEVS